MSLFTGICNGTADGPPNIEKCRWSPLPTPALQPNQMPLACRGTDGSRRALIAVPLVTQTRDMAGTGTETTQPASMQL